jgi:glycosyltransferase involved in cell wall biosynthesis
MTPGARDLSVVICTQNPRADCLARAMDALVAQTLDRSSWELLLVDNGSEPPLGPRVDLSWHPSGWCVREDEVGLTPARLRGIGESSGEVVVFVDDDNVLVPDYLEQALAISREWPMLGAWGGLVIPEFEVEPPKWTRECWPLLALRDFASDYWSNLDVPLAKLPCGAGMCVRRWVAVGYADSVSRDPIRYSLDRRGTSLVSAGDSDLALTACDAGLGVGMFRALRCIHLIPKSRLEEDYLLRLAESIHYSSVILDVRRGRLALPEPLSAWRRFAGSIRRHLTMARTQRRIFEAKLSGRQRAIREIQGW